MNGKIDKIMDILDNLYNIHMVNGATLFGVALAIYGITKISQLGISTWELSLGANFFFALAVYEMSVKGIVVYQYKKRKSKFQSS